MLAAIIICLVFALQNQANRSAVYYAEINSIAKVNSEFFDKTPKELSEQYLEHLREKSVTKPGDPDIRQYVKAYTEAAKRFSPNAPQTRLEEFSLYAGKTDEELRSRFGQPDTTSWQSVAEPENLSEAEQEEWWKNTAVYILRYGNINVEENQDHVILRVYAD